MPQSFKVLQQNVQPLRIDILLEMQRCSAFTPFDNLISNSPMQLYFTVLITNGRILSRSRKCFVCTVVHRHIGLSASTAGKYVETVGTAESHMDHLIVVQKIAYCIRAKIDFQCVLAVCFTLVSSYSSHLFW